MILTSSTLGQSPIESEMFLGANVYQFLLRLGLCERGGNFWAKEVLGYALEFNSYKCVI